MSEGEDGDSLLPIRDRTLFMVQDDPGYLMRAEASIQSLDEIDQQHFEDEGKDQGIMVIEDPRTSFGTKTIGSFSSYVFIINQIFGPGVLALPILFQEAGWISTVIALIIFTFVSSFASTLLCEAIRLIPGNHNFERRYEYALAVKYYFGNRVHFLFQISLCLCLLSVNIASIVIVAESLDNVFVFLFGKSFTLMMYPESGFFAGDEQTVSSWYNSIKLTITLGYFILMICCIPMGLINLDENMKFQWVSFIGLVVLIGDFLVSYLVKAEFHWDQVPPIGDQFTQLAGVCISSWAYVMLVPSWVNEKKDHVSINKTIWLSAAVSGVAYIAVGIILALAFVDLSSFVILKEMASSNNFILTRIAAHLFALFIIFPGIPVLCITTRYNLYVGGICGRKTSYFIGVFLPWLIGFIFSQGPIFASLLNWTALLFSSWVNFVIPFLLYLKAKRFTPFNWKWMRCICGYEDNQQTHLYYDLLSNIASNTDLPFEEKEEESGHEEDGQDEAGLDVNPFFGGVGGGVDEEDFSFINVDESERWKEFSTPLASSKLTRNRQRKGNPLPALCKPIATHFVFFLLVLIFTLIALQVGIDVYFLIVKGESPI